MRTIILGDIHGCFRELTELMEKVGFDREADTLISLGDLMDRGEQSYEVFDLFRHLKQDMKERCTIVRGNHEQMMMESAADPSAVARWRRNGCEATMKSFEEHGSHVYQYAEWFRENTVLFYEEDAFRCVHAGFTKDELSENTLRDLIWDRTRIANNDYQGKLTIIGHTEVKDAVWLCGDEKTKVVLEEGKKIALPKTGLIGMDTGCVYGHRLSAMVIEGKEFFMESVSKR